jgi:hypothetical protein
MAGKLIAAANATESRLNIGSALGAGAPTTLFDGDLWITNQNKLAFRSSGTTINAAGTNQSNTYSQPQTISSTSNAAAVLSASNTGTREVATFTNTISATSDAVVITNLGSGNSLVVNDDVVPDSTRFAVSNTGRVGVGVAPDATVALSVDTTGIKFGDNTIQTTAATGASYLPYAFETMDHFNGSSSPLQLTGAGVAGGSAAYVNPTTYNGFGIFRIETQNSTTANSGARINQTGNTISFSPKGIGEFRHISRAMRISADMFDGTIQGTFRTGIGDVINALPNNGIYFQCINSNSVSFVTRSAGVETLTNTGFSILQDAWNSFEFILATDGLSVVAKINNNIVATHTTNIPNAYMGVITFLQKQVAVAGYVRFDFDFIYQKFTPSPIPFNP